MQKTIKARGSAYKWVASIVFSIGVAVLGDFVLGRSAGTLSADAPDDANPEQMLLEARLLNIQENAGLSVTRLSKSTNV